VAALTAAALLFFSPVFATTSAQAHNNFEVGVLGAPTNEKQSACKLTDNRIISTKGTVEMREVEFANSTETCFLVLHVDKFLPIYKDILITTYIVGDVLTERNFFTTNNFHIFTAQAGIAPRIRFAIDKKGYNINFTPRAVTTDEFVHLPYQ
jgi:hypothetical protein